MINTSFLLEQCYGARRAGACEPLLAASVGGRAAWPTARHLADKLPRTAEPKEKAVFIMFPRDVAQSRLRLRPDRNPKFAFFVFFRIFAQKKNYNFAVFPTEIRD